MKLRPSRTPHNIRPTQNQQKWIFNMSPNIQNTFKCRHPNQCFFTSCFFMKFGPLLLHKTTLRSSIFDPLGIPWRSQDPTWEPLWWPNDPELSFHNFWSPGWSSGHQNPPKSSFSTSKMNFSAPKYVIFSDHRTTYTRIP